MLIRKLQESHVPRILEIADKRLGSNPKREANMKRALQSPSGFIIGAFATQNEAELIGFCRGTTQPHPAWDPQARGGPFGIIESIAVEAGEDRRHAGTGLFGIACAHLTDLGARTLAIAGWRNAARPKAPITGIAEKFGFRIQGEQARYWKGLPCPRCGGDCKCTAVFYLRGT